MYLLWDKWYNFGVWIRKEIVARWAAAVAVIAALRKPDLSSDPT